MYRGKVKNKIYDKKGERTLISDSVNHLLVAHLIPQPPLAFITIL